MTRSLGPTTRADRLSGRLSEGPVVLLDGGVGTELLRRGHSIQGHPLWGSSALLSAEGRAGTTALHQAYVAAGAELLVANTHNANLASCRRAEPTRGEALLREVNLRAVEAARAARPRFIAACTMSPDQPYATQARLTEDQVEAAYAPQLGVLDGLGLDLIVFEMLSTEADVLGAAAAARGRYDRMLWIRHWPGTPASG